MCGIVLSEERFLANLHVSDLAGRVIERLLSAACRPVALAILCAGTAGEELSVRHRLEARKAYRGLSGLIATESIHKAHR